jgi:hypothetical protein
VPLAPDLGGSEHATGTALVTKGSLTGTVSTTTGDTGDTSDSTAWSREEKSDQPQIRCFPYSIVVVRKHTGTPGLSGSLFTSLLAHGVGLSLVLGQTGVNLPVVQKPSVRYSLISILFAESVSLHRNSCSSSFPCFSLFSSHLPPE